MNPHALAGASPSSWCVCLFRHFDVDSKPNCGSTNRQPMISAIPVLLGKEHCESDHREEPSKRKYRRNAVEVALGSSRTESRAASAAEHVGQATAAAERNLNRITTVLALSWFLTVIALAMLLAE